jgi:hypothetical protein
MVRSKMQLVIDIDDKLYRIIKDPKQVPTMYHAGKIWNALANGTPLSKGHGRIGDLDKLDNRLKRMQSRHADPIDVTGNAIACGIALARDAIDNAPKIIEADKSEGEE